LGPGDVVVLERSGLTHGATGFSGSVQLRVANSGRAWLGRATRRSIEIEPADAGEETLMTTGKITTTDALQQDAVHLAGDAPVELCVELARFVVTFGELAGLCPGQVLSTGRDIGACVTLRAAGCAVAEGELVDIDGEVGVRIARLLNSSGR
jgi:type III secretion system YscQ/HrcQ family protein